MMASDNMWESPDGKTLASTIQAALSRIQRLGEGIAVSEGEEAKG